MRILVDRLSRGEQRAQFADTPFEQSQRVHRVAQVKVLCRIVATGSGIAESGGNRRQLSLEPGQLCFQLAPAF